MNHKIRAGIVRRFVAVDQHEIFARKIVDEPRRGINGERSPRDDQHIRRRNRRKRVHDDVVVKRFAVKHDLGFNHSAARTARYAGSPHDRLYGIFLSAFPAAVTVHAPMKLIDLFAPRKLMQTVDILRDDGAQFPRLFPFGKLIVSGVRLRAQKQHFFTIKPIELFRVLLKIAGAQHSLGRNRVFHAVQPVLRTEIGNSAFRRNARSAEKHDIVALAHHLRKQCDFVLYRLSHHFIFLFGQLYHVLRIFSIVGRQSAQNICKNTNTVLMKRPIKLLFWLAGTVCVFALAAVVFYFSATAGTQLQPEKLALNRNCVRLYDENGEEIKQPQTCVPYEELPAPLLNAFVAVEDKRFYSHRGLDYKRIIKATAKNAVGFSFREGASTISQQLIKNTHLSGEKTVTRKLKEFKLARQLEKRYSKEEILEFYVNSIYFGHSAFGIGNAAAFYFGKETKDLDAAECAMLAALVKSPNRYSPFKDAEKCLSRRNFVIELMEGQGFLSEEDAQQAKREPLPESPTPKQEQNAYISLVYEELSELFPDVSSGEELNVFTFYDPALQEKLEQTQTDCGHCLLVRSNGTNGVKALASTCGVLKRQPASLVKPLAVYAPALEENLISPATPVLDEAVDYSGYTPSNYGGKYEGYMSVRYALSHSVNIPAVKILNELKPNCAARYLEKMNLSVSEEDRTLALALGGMRNGFTLPELADAFSTFTNDGVFSPSSAVRRVENEKGKILYEFSPFQRKVFSNDVCYLINDMLQTTAKEGTAKKLKSLPFPVCAKTGTTGTDAGNTDAYTIAYTTEDTVAVWLGNSDNSPIEATGGGLPANIALTVLQTLYKDRAPKPFLPCDDVVEIAFDKEEYENNRRLVQADPLAPSYLTQKELFRASAIPQETSSRFSSPKIEKPLIYVKNGAVYIKLCQTQYYSYIVKRENNGNSVTIYEGKYRETICDNSVRQGERYTYTVTPIWQGVYGETIRLPSVQIDETQSIPDDWW